MSGGVEALRHLELMALNTAQTASAARKVNECVALLAASLTAPPARTYAEGVSASEMVARWQQEHLAEPGSHWGDAVAWNSAYVIAAKLDEAAATSRSQHEGAE